MSLDYTLAVVAGRLVRPAEVKTIASGNTVASFTVASSKKWKDKSGTEQKSSAFVDVKVWGKLAEFVARSPQYFDKGQGVLVQGELVQENWEKDGQKRSKLLVEASSIKLTTFPDDANGAAPAPAAAPAARAGRAPAPAPAADDDDSIPF